MKSKFAYKVWYRVFLLDKILLHQGQTQPGGIEFRKCHTKDMWIDVNTKPKQGKPFRIDRSKLMNVPIDYNDELE